LLSLQLKSGEYLTIGDDIAVQVFKQSGSTFRVAVKAPRELTILRGELHERTEERPAGLHSHRPKSPSERRRTVEQLDKLAARRAYFAAERRRQDEARADAVGQIRDIVGRMDDFVQAHGGERGLNGELTTLQALLNQITSPVEPSEPPIHLSPAEQE